MDLIAEGDSLQSLPLQEPLLSEGQEGEVRLYLDRMPSEGELAAIENGILAQGVVLTGHVTAVGPILIVPFRKMLAPLAIIALVAGGIIATGTTLLGWQLFKTFVGIPWYVWALGFGALFYLFIYRPVKPIVKETAPIAIKAGKVYLTRKALPRRFAND